MVSASLLLISAAAVGIIHMSAPDHWVTLTVLSQNLGWKKSKLMSYTLVTGAGHSITSIALGLAIVLLGLLFSSHIVHYIALTVGAVMIVAGLFVGIRSIVRKEDDEHHHDDGKGTGIPHRREERSGAKGIGYMAILGAAMSPDLSVLPIFLIAVPEGISMAISIAIVFALASVITVVILVSMSSAGLSRAFQKIPSKYNDALVGFVIAAVGVYVILSG